MTVPRYSVLLTAAICFLQAGLSLGQEQFPYGTCYFPSNDGKATKADGFEVCDKNSERDHCCPVGWGCYSNHLCVELGEGWVIRAACSSPQWSNEICATFCISANDTDGKMAYCGGDDFCCQAELDAGSCDCVTRKGTIKLDRSQMLPQQIVGEANSVFAPSSPSISITKEPLLPGETSTTGIVSTTSTSAGAGDTTPTETASTPTETANDGGKSGLSTGAKAGIGAGVGIIAIAALAGLAWYIRRKRYIKRHFPAGHEPVGARAGRDKTNISETES